MNSKRGQVSTISIILLVVGLLVGGIGSYYFTSSSLQPKIDDYEAQVADLNSEISDLNAIASSQEEEIAEYELQVYHLIQEIMVLESQVSDDTQTISDMQSELDELEQTISDHEDMISGMEQNIINYKNEIETSQELAENTQKFEKYILLGVECRIDGLINEAYADAQYDEFSDCYDLDLYALAQYYADNMDIYYAYAQHGFEEAKAFFELARKYAPSDKYIELIDNYVGACDLAVEMNSEMHQVGEYYSSACDCYGKGQWSAGGRAIDEGNTHLEIRDNLVLEYNEYLYNIDALLEDW